jgi:hypothetical protein
MAPTTFRSGTTTTRNEFTVPAVDTTVESTGSDSDSESLVSKDESQETEIDLHMLEAFATADRQRQGKLVQLDQ